MTTKKILLYFIPALILVMSGFATSVSAMTITPVRYEVQGDPGSTVTEDMTIINEDNYSVTYYSSFANFEAQGETGSATFVKPTDGIGTWMTTESSVTLLPGEQKTVSFNVKIPQNAEPGGHFGVIFWGTSPENSDSQQVSVSAKTGLLVLLSVNGSVKEGGGLLEYGTKDNQFWYNTLPVSLVYRFQNNGGDRIKPVGEIKLRSFGFIPVKKLNANGVNGNILPNSTRKFTVDWVKYKEPADAPIVNGGVNKFFHTALYQWRNFAVGLFSANLNLTYGLLGQNAKESTYFFVFPWQLLICLIILFIIVFFIGKKLIGRYNNYIIKMAHSTVKTPEDGSHV